MAKKANTISNVENDEVAVGVQNAIDFLRKNAMALTSAAALAIVAILSYVTIVSNREKQASDVTMAITQAMQRLNTIEASTNPEERVKTADALVSFMNDFIGQHPDGELAIQARYIKGRALFEADQYEAAQNAYNDFIAKAPNAEMTARGELGLGYAIENQSFTIDDAKRQTSLLNDALKAYEQAAGHDSASYVHYYALMAQARVHELLHQNDKAIALYRQVVKDRPLPMVQPSDKAQSAKANEASAANEQYAILRERIDQGLNQIGFKQTAQLRLDRLTKGAAKAKAPAPVVTPKP